MVAVTELVSRLGMIKLLDAAIGPIKARGRGCTGGELLVGVAAAQLSGEDFLVGLDRWRADAVGQVLAPVAGLSSTTAAGLARRFTEGQWRAVETGIGEVHTAMLAALSPRRAAALCETVTVDLDTTDVEVYGRKKRGVAYNYQGVRHEARMTERRCESFVVGPSQRSGRSWGQPEPGNAGEGGKQPRQRRDGTVLLDEPGPASETRRCNASEPVAEAP
jgi:hypothetical protein